MGGAVLIVSGLFLSTYGDGFFEKGISSIGWGGKQILIAAFEIPPGIGTAAHCYLWRNDFRI